MLKYILNDLLESLLDKFYIFTGDKDKIFTDAFVIELAVIIIVYIYSRFLK